MNEPKHTPGPWEVKWANNEDAFLIGHGGHTVFLLRGSDEEEFIQLNEANARLIAAAPDLLKALQWLLSYDSETSRDQALAAIKKATQL